MNEQDRLEDELRRAYKDEIIWKEGLDFNKEVDRFNRFMMWIAWTVFVFVMGFIIYVTINIALIRDIK